MDEKFNETLLVHPKIEFYVVEPASQRIIRSNMTARSNLQLSESELHQRSILEITAPDSEPRMRDLVQQMQAEVVSQRSFSSHHRQADGGEYAVKVFIYSTAWQGQPVWVLLAIADLASAESQHDDLLAQIQTRAKIGGWQLSFPGQQFYWTEEVFRIHGMSPATQAQVDFEQALNTYLPESRERLVEYTRGLTNDPTAAPLSWDAEFTLVTADVEKRHVHIVGHSEVGEQGVVRLFGTIQDRTEQRQAEESLANFQYEYHHLLEAAPYGIFQLDSECRILAANNSGAMFFGQPATMLVGKDYRLLIHGADQLAIEQALTGALQGEGCVTELRTAVGQVHAISAYPLVGQEDDPKRVMVINHDVTADRELSRTIAASEKKYRLLFDSSPDMVILHDKDGQLVDVNPMACTLLGYERDQLLQKNITDLDPSWFENHFTQGANLTSDDGRFSGESTLMIAAGQRLAYEYDARVDDLDGDQAVLVYLRDLTERNQRERMQREMASRVQQSQKLESLGVLAGGIAHDFNNLLTSMLGNANLAATALGSGHAAIRNLENIEAAAVRAGELCSQMLTYAGQGRFALEPTDLNQLVEEMTRLLELTVSKKAVVKYHLETNLPTAIADPAQIRQALMNMVLNASEAIGDTSGLITINTGMMRAQTSYLQETYLSPDLPEGDYLYLEVNDNGGGMTPEVKQRIFDPFFSTKFTGRGLGLAAVLGIVRSHDGVLKVYSEPGRGTTFKLLLPLASDAETMPAGAQIGEPPALAGLVLIADDEESVAAVTAQMVEALGLQAVIATNGRECLDLFVSDPASFDLVLLDLMMPEMNGEETFRELRAVDPAAKIILTSGFNEQDAAHRFSGKGLAGFLQKPYHLSELKQILELVLSKASDLP